MPAGRAVMAAVPAVHGGPRDLVQYTAVYMMFLLTIITDGAGNYFLQLTDTRHI